MGRLKSWIRYKYRPYPIWKFWKNLKDKYRRMCMICTNNSCDSGLLQQYGCYRIRKEIGYPC